MNLQLNTSSKRIQSIDFLRGIVMVIMALDHVRDFFSNANFNPVDLSRTNEWMFFTRWITHYCAPVFVFLAGVSAFLYGNKCSSRSELSLFLLSRGLWIALLELTAVRFGWFFNFDYTLVVGQVIWAIGIVMVLLSAIVYLPEKIVGIVGILIIGLHNLLDVIKPAYFGKLNWVWKLIHQTGVIEYTPGYLFVVGYPLLPWLGIICAGYGFGIFFLKTEDERRKIFFWIGFSLIALFIVLRYSNYYGDAALWHAQNSSVFALMSFLNCTKYPPSLLYACMTLGPAILLLPFLDKWRGRIANFFVTIGSVPMFYYLCHLFLIHGLAVGVAYFSGIDIAFLFSNTPPWSTERIFGYGLPIVYLVWIVVVAMLFPLSKWFSNLKKKHKDWWMLSYV